MGTKNTAETGIAGGFVDRNSVINTALIIISLILAFTKNPFCLLIWPLFLLLDDVLLLLFKCTVFDSEVSVRRSYQFLHLFLERTSGYGRDLGFNLYDGDITKDPHQSQKDKWEFMLSQLDLQEGDRLIDIGCGYGDWLNVARKKGIEVVGVNLSPEQAIFAKQEYGLDVIRCNWKNILTDLNLQEKLFGKFDAITFMDTIEHYVHYSKGGTKEAETTYKNMFNLAHRLLNPKSRTGRVFISCLHMNPTVAQPSKFFVFRYQLKNFLSSLLLIRMHSGSYPWGDDGLTKHCTPFFSEISRYDKTEDYRLTGVLDNEHFQSPKIKWTRAKILYIPYLMLVDPHHIYKWLDFHYDAWMNYFGKDNYERKHDPEKRRRTSMVTLWWLILKHNQDVSNNQALS
ncbi:MAG: class I SAM-dependent methyltransferase [Candidatus Lindowbacteria bacterium]|nr:class I SAM-dependent methyltransferase [Candidatus Lindowbacteria bacterium]